MADSPTYGVPTVAFWVIPEPVGAPVVSDPRMVILYFEGFNGAGSAPVLKFIDDAGVITRLLTAADGATALQVPYMDDGTTFPSILRMSPDLLYMILDGDLWLGDELGTGAVSRMLRFATGVGGSISIGAEGASDDTLNHVHRLPQTDAATEGQVVAVSALTSGNIHQWDFMTADVCLARGVSVDLNITTKQVLYTVPTGREFIVTKVVVRNPSATVTTMVGSFGYNAGASDVIASFNGSTYLTNTGIYYPFQPQIGAVKGTAAQNFGFKASVAEGSARTMVVDVWGYLI